MNDDQKSITKDTQLPRFYSKNLIWVFCILFSTIFGTVLLMSNLKSINENKGRWQVLLFGIIFTFGAASTLASTGAGSNLSLPLNILGGLILNEYFWNRYIGKETEFEKKSWHKPVLISLLICIPFVVFILYSSQL